jgi:hypothetical protein
MGGLAVDIICFEAIGSSSPLDSNCLSLALRAQPLRLGHGQASLPRLSPCEVVGFEELHFANVEFFFFRAFPAFAGRAIFYGLFGSLRSLA